MFKIFIYLLTMGYSLIDFGKFIISKLEFWLIFLGLFLIIIALERWIKHELWIRHNFKLERRRI